MQDPSGVWLSYGGVLTNNVTAQNDTLIAPFPALSPPQGAADQTIVVNINATSAVTWQLGNETFDGLRFQQEPLLFHPGDVTLNPKDGAMISVSRPLT